MSPCAQARRAWARHYTHMGTAIDGITMAVKYATPARAAVPTATPIFCFIFPVIAAGRKAMPCRLWEKPGMKLKKLTKKIVPSVCSSRFKAGPLAAGGGGFESGGDGRGGARMGGTSKQVYCLKKTLHLRRRLPLPLPILRSLTARGEGAGARGKSGRAGEVKGRTPATSTRTLARECTVTLTPTRESGCSPRGLARGPSRPHRRAPSPRESAR